MIGWRHSSRPRKKSIATDVRLISIIFSLAIYLGTQGMLETWIISFDSLCIVKSICMLLGYYALFSSVLTPLVGFLESPRAVDNVSPMDVKALIAVAAILIVAWSPIVFAIAPGRLNSDLTSQISQAYGMAPRTNHHPYISSVLYAAIFSIGRSLFGTIGGVVFFCFTQTISMAIAFAWALRWLGKMGVSRNVMIACLAFWAFIPLFPMWSQIFVKDVYAALSLFIYVVLLSIRFWHTEKAKPMPGCAKLPMLALAALAAALTRNNNIYAVIPSLLLLCMVERKRWKPIVTAISIVMIYGFLTTILLPSLGVVGGSCAEALSVPIQQVARTMVEHGDDLSPKESQTLKAVFGEKRVEHVDEYYKSWVSDPMKTGVDFSGKDGSLKEFLKVWLALGIRHPGTYLQQFVLCGLGYWCPGVSGGDEIPFLPVVESPTDWLDLHEGEIPGCSGPARLTTWKLMRVLQNLPVLGIVMDKAFYTWALLILLVVAERFNRKSFIVYLPLAITFAVCCISPVSKLMRYTLPLVFLLPYMYGFTRLLVNSCDKKMKYRETKYAI